LLQITDAISPKTKFPVKKQVDLNEVVLADSFTTLLQKSNAVAERNVALAKAAYFPELTAGLINRKTGNVIGYTGFRVGLKIPLSIWSKNAKVKRQQLEKEKVVFENNATKIAMQNSFKSLQEQLTYLSKELVSLDTSKKQATTFLNKLQLAYKSGEIDAYQFGQSFNAYFQVIQHYLALINNYNQTVIAYQYYTKD